jgi:hypothetical protein
VTKDLLEPGRFSYRTEDCVNVKPPAGFHSATWADMYRNAIMVGYGPSYLSALAGALMRLSAVDTGLVLQGGHWWVNPAFSRLDETDKAVVSYNLGMTLASVGCTSILKLPLLTHLSTHMKEQGLARAKGKRADFIATSTANSSIVALIEAKGRGSMADVGSAVRKARRQLDETPISAPQNVVSVAYFSDDGALRLLLTDPPDENVPARFPVAKLLYSHYAPAVRAMIENGVNSSRSSSRVSSVFKDHRFVFSLPASVFDAVRVAAESGSHEIDPSTVAGSTVSSVSAPDGSPTVSVRVELGSDQTSVDPL